MSLIFSDLDDEGVEGPDEDLTLSVLGEGSGPLMDGSLEWRPTPDGGLELIDAAALMVSGLAPKEEIDDFDANLADDGRVPESALDGYAADIIEMVESDLEARSPWYNRLERGLEILGLADIPDEDGPFPGAASVTHPLILEAVVQFQARAMSELFPPAGPVKTIILGEETPELREKADRVADYMNYQCTVEDPGYYRGVERMLFYLPIAGTAFKKTYRNTVLDRTDSDFVKADDFIVPYTATDLETASRYTHRIKMVPNELAKRQAQGVYRDIPLEEPEARVEETSNDPTGLYHELDDRDPTGANQFDGEHLIYECHIDLDLEGYEDTDELGKPTGIALPYIVTVEAQSGKILSIYRNWRKDDELKRKRVWFTMYEYLPGLGFYGFGLLHAIGSLNEAATGALRALLDSAAFANMQGGFLSEDATFDKGEVVMQPGVYHPTKMSSEELSRSFYTPPFREPSVALQRLFDALGQIGQRFASTTEAMVGDAPNTGPVGTTVALIEQGSKVFSGVHKRTHASAGHEFRLRKEINAEYTPEEGYPYKVVGATKEIMREDFDSDISVVPVSDPMIFSRTQRIAQAQAAHQLSQSDPDLYNRPAVHLRMLKALDMGNPEELLVSGAAAIPMDPASENIALITGKPIQAFADQDHDAHIAVHMGFLEHPQFGGNPQAQELIGGAMIAHLAEHMALKYQQGIMQMGIPLPEFNLNTGPDEPPVEATPPEVQNAIAKAVAMNLEALKQVTGIAPPKPQEEPDPANARLALNLKLREEMHQQEMRFKREEHELDMQIEQATARSDIAKRVALTAADQRRKDASMQADKDTEALETVLSPEPKKK